jgi:TPR repeat protein
MKKTIAMMLVAAALLSTTALAADPKVGARGAEWKAKADKGDIKAQYNLAVCFHTGSPDCEQNDAAAAKYLRMASMAGDATASVNLGQFYHEGLGVQKDDNVAVSFYRSAAAKGSAEAEYNLGIFYEQGWGVPKKDDALAMKWFEHAANQGQVEAQMELAQMHLQSATPDYESAYFWFAVAAKSDDTAGKYKERVAKTLSAEQVAAQDKKIAEWKPVYEGADINRANHP